jgi:hypothetical protein
MKKWEDSKAKYVRTDNSDICPFCGCTDIYAGANTYESCINCHAGWMIGIWKKLKIKQPTGKEG